MAWPKGRSRAVYNRTHGRVVTRAELAETVEALLAHDAVDTTPARPVGRPPRWQPGDRFTVSRGDASLDPLVFTISRVTDTHVYFWCPALGETPRAARRRIPRAGFTRRVRRAP